MPILGNDTTDIVFLTITYEDVLAKLVFANLFGHLLARESAKSIFPNIPARKPYFEKKNSKTFENS